MYRARARVARLEVFCMAVTLKKIAELAGVSRGTVDRVLNCRGGVSIEAENRIKALVEELDYKPNLVAKALVNSRKNHTIGVLVNSGGNHFFDKVMMGIERAGHEIEGFNVSLNVVELTGYDISTQLCGIDELVSSGINALVVTPINDKLIIERLNQVTASGIDVVTLNADVTGVDKLTFVGCDYKKSGNTAAELLGLITGGIAKVLVVTGSSKMLGHTKRVNGFRSVIHERYPKIRVAEVCEAFDNDVEAYIQTTRMLTQHSDVTAIYFCAGGIDGGIKAVTDLNLANKLKIITVDDTENIKEYLAKDLVQVTVCQQPFKQGHDAIKIAFDKLIYNKVPQKKHMYTQNVIKTKYNLS